MAAIVALHLKAKYFLRFQGHPVPGERGSWCFGVLHFQHTFVVCFDCAGVVRSHVWGHPDPGERGIWCFGCCIFSTLLFALGCLLRKCVLTAQAWLDRMPGLLRVVSCGPESEPKSQKKHASDVFQRGIGQKCLHPFFYI